MSTPKSILSVFAVAFLVIPAAAGAFPVTWGASWDGPEYALQNVVNSYLGAGVINVMTDYIGHDAGEPDPLYLTLGQATATLVSQTAQNADLETFGWYRRTAGVGAPILDGIDDGVLFPVEAAPGASQTLDLVSRYGAPVEVGFFLTTPGSAWGPETFFSDRRFNDVGLTGMAMHAPYTGGDPQVLIYDLSAIRGYASYLMAWEDLDSGGAVGYSNDNDFNDLVVEVRAATPVPEPGTLMLLGSGLIGFVTVLRRRAART